ncbi:MAG: hypothetical protein IT317_05615 [Anaerolineales bacterium]|nr:hypothetical protein [Anaerolineales bacterium]
MSLPQRLSTLERADLIRLITNQPEPAYRFRHALVREAVYASLVRADRKRLHLAAAETLEAMQAVSGQPISPELAALLAQHYHEAGDARAQDHATHAGQAALTRFANAEALTHFTLALEWAQRAGATAELATLFAARGRALELLGRFPEALENYQALEAAGQAHGDQRLKLRGLVYQGKLRATLNPLFNPDEGLRLAAATLPLAEALGDLEAQAGVHWNTLNLHRFTGNMPAARASGEQSLALARAAGDVEQEAASLNDLLHVYGALGAWPEQQAAAHDVAERWRALGNLPMLADSLSTTSYYAAMRGDFDRAVAASTEAGRISRSINNLWGQSYCLTGAVIAHWYRGEYATGLSVVRECLRLAGLAGFLGAFALNRAQLAALLLDLGQAPAALDEAQAAFEFAETRLPAMRPMGVSALALAQIRLGQLASAAETLERVPLASVQHMLPMASGLYRAHGELALARRAPDAVADAEGRLAAMQAFQAPPLIIEGRLMLAQALRLTGQLAAARALLLEARPEAEALGARRLLWPILAELAGVAAELDAAAEADQWGARAQAVVTAIAAGLPGVAERAAFERWAGRLLDERRAPQTAPAPRPKRQSPRRRRPAVEPKTRNDRRA